jgi:tetratricopeptide (TPR) repeat protein
MALLSLIFSVVSALAQDMRWETATIAGVQAFNQGQYTEAALQFQAALALAEASKSDAMRLSTSLTNLAAVYYSQGQYAPSAPLYQRALVLQEQLFGPEHPQLLDVLQAYEALLRRMYPVRSLLPWSPANKLAFRARRIEEREARSGVQAPPGTWLDYEESSIFRDGS